jgi:predicted ATPase/DNA-binding XRE family transcriptional regulator
MATRKQPEQRTQLSFGKRLRQHRRAAGLTQEELAERASLSPRGLRYLERGVRAPFPDTVRRLVAALGLHPEDEIELSNSARQERQRSGRRYGFPPLPAPNGDLVGRQHELASALELLRESRVRLLTITGPGGVGKTRLALEIADALERQFADGVVWVPLAGLTAAEQVGPSVLQALGGSESNRLNLEDALVARLRDLNALLIIDNFEHVTRAAVLIGALLPSCPDVKLLVTSRAPLRLGSEREFTLSPLPVPRADHVMDRETIASNAAVELFTTRARAMVRDFNLTDTNAASVVEICRRLDGLPLALELAAARVRTLRPEEMVQQLDHHLALLTKGPVDAPPRQRTLRDTLDWSYALLEPAEQSLLRRLAVFASGCSFAAIRAICTPADDPDLNLVDAIDGLQRNSLLDREDPPGTNARYVLLETVREYALDRLGAAPEEEHEVRTRHADWYSSLARDLSTQLQGAAQAAAVVRLEEEHDNLRAALRWWLQIGAADRALDLASSLWMFWYIRGYAAEGRAQLSSVLELPATAEFPQLKARALTGAGQLARARADYPAARALMEESVALYQACGDQQGTATALFGTGFVARMQGDSAAARQIFDKALELSRAGGDQYVSAMALHHLGMMAAETDRDYASARSLLEEALVIFRQIGFPRHVALALATLGDVERAEGNYDRAQQFLSESLNTFVTGGQKHEIHLPLEAVANLAFDHGDAARAVVIAAAADGLRNRLGDPPFPGIARQRERWLASAREELGQPGFTAAWAQGAAMSADDIISYLAAPGVGSQS